MSPPRKKTKVAPTAEDKKPDPSTSGPETDWLVWTEGQDVELISKEGTRLRANKTILTKQSEYFQGCLSRDTYVEAAARVVHLDHIESKYLGLWIGLAYSFSTMALHAQPAQVVPEVNAPSRPLRDYVEVYKLCDYFISPAIGKYIRSCILSSTLDGHRALFRAPNDADLQKLLMINFADAYEAFHPDLVDHIDLAKKLVNAFCEGVSYGAWDKEMDAVADRTLFVAAVSRHFARKLHEILLPKRLRRKEIREVV